MSGMERERDGTWWGVNGVTGIGNGVWVGVGQFRGKRFNRSGDEDGVAVVMETGRRGNSSFSRQTIRQTDGHAGADR